MKKLPHPRWILPAVSAAGIIAFGLHRWLLTSGFDHKGLLRTDHPATAPLLILTGLVLLGLFLWLRQPLKQSNYQTLFPVSALAAAGCWMAAIGIVFTVFSALAESTERLVPVSLALGIAAVAALVILGIFRLLGRRPHYIFHSLITVYLMVRLLNQYQLWSAETQPMVYFFPLMASVFLMLSTYHQATVDAGFGKLSTAVFFRCGALFFCLPAMCAADLVFYLSMSIWLVTAGCRLSVAVKTVRLPLPRNVQLCMDMLNKAGFKSYAVGGCVRDLLLGRTPHDYDICTNATPEQTAAVFADYELVRSGEKHGTIGVVLDHQVYEITTFRTEGGYSDSRHPDWVKFVPDVKQDLARRDFTVNAMAYSPEAGVIDPFGGQQDMADGILRTVGDPGSRFTEDALRILRGVRFAARFRLTPHPDTEKAMNALATTMESLAKERVFSELCQLLPWVTAEDLLRYKAVITQVIPELSAAVDFQQHSPHHAYDVYTHTAYVVQSIPNQLPLRLAALLHDVAKPATFSLDEQGVGHFYDHATVSADMADAILTRLRAPTALRQQVVLLIRQHMSVLTADEKLLRRRLAQYGEETLRQLLALQKADRAGKGTADVDTDSDAALALLEEILAQQNCFSLKQLAVSGNDLMEIGFAPGPEIGKVLNALLDKVVDQQLPNEKDALLAQAKAMKEDL